MFLDANNKVNWLRIFWAALIVVGIVLGGVYYFDVPVSEYLRQFDCVGLKRFSRIFGVKYWLLISGIIVILFYIKKSLHEKPKFSLSDFYNKIKGSYAFWVFCSVIIATGMGGVLKFIIGRIRPIAYGMYAMPNFLHFARDDAFHSMPSGHTFASFAGLVMIGMVWPRSRWFMWTLATVIGVSRICLGKHWPSDVILGAFIGIVAATVTRAWFARRTK